MRLSPAAVRITPFAIYMVFIAMESIAGASRTDAANVSAASRWLYFAQIGSVGVLLLLFRNAFDELRAASLSAGQFLLGLVAGLAVYLLWIALDQPWATLGSARPLGNAFAMHDLPYAVLRMIGVAIVVPIMEELFWRSFLLRWIERQDFLRVVPATVGLRALLISAVLFGLEHHMIVAGVLAGLIYGELYRRTGNLWIVILAHTTTNAVLEVWP